MNPKTNLDSDSLSFHEAKNKSRFQSSATPWSRKWISISLSGHSESQKWISILLPGHSESPKWISILLHWVSVKAKMIFDKHAQTPSEGWSKAIFGCIYFRW